MDLAVVEGMDAVAVPEASRGFFEQVGQAPFEQVLVPVADLGEVLQFLPALVQAQGDERLGDGVFFDVEGQAGDPDDKGAEAAGGEGGGERGQQGLPERPEQGSLQGTPPGCLAETLATPLSG
jgi:hypothetical protein